MRDEYADDAAFYSEDEHDDHDGVVHWNEKMGEEDWQSYFEDQLLDLYDEFLRMNRTGGWPIFDRLTYEQFAQFAWAHSSGYPTVR